MRYAQKNSLRQTPLFLSSGVASVQSHYYMINIKLILLFKVNTNNIGFKIFIII